MIATYDQGACLNFGQWLRADDGDKGEHTYLPPEILGRMLAGLEKVAEGHRGGNRFRRQGNVYVPRPKSLRPDRLDH